ncbi:MAG: hypothetical protein MUP74_02320, partial [Desulfobacterales bacterium]|nr:hypothetical protein [Desulfobacterales bacterium]
MRETRERVQKLVEFQAVAFFLVDPASAEFRLADCHPEGQQEVVEGQVDRLIHDGVFAWALRERQPVSVPSSDRRWRLVLRAMSTRS